VELQHAILDEMEWLRENEALDAPQRDKAVDELMGLVAAMDGIVPMQAQADAEYFVMAAARAFDDLRKRATTPRWRRSSAPRTEPTGKPVRCATPAAPAARCSGPC